jgi:hypothetical protein
MTTEQFPIETCPPKVLPLLIEARERLHRLAAPQASAIADRIGAALEALIDVAGDVECYGNKWTGGRMEEIAAQIREATREWNDV